MAGADPTAPEANYEITALRITCPHCGGALLGRNGTSLIVRHDGHRPGETVTCKDCGRPYRLPAIIDLLGD